MRTENFWWNKANYSDSPHLRGKIDGFLRDGNRAMLNWNTNGSRCDICVQTVGCAKSAGPGRPAAPTDPDDFFSWSGPHLPPPGSDLCMVYIWYISGISHLSWYIPVLCFHYTWWLVLRWWARPHTAWHGPIPSVYMKVHWFQIPISGIWYMTGIYQVYTTY